MLERFETAWRSQTHGKKDTLHTKIQTLLRVLDGERKRHRVIVTICSAYTLLSLIATGIIFSRGEINISEVWPLGLAQAIAVIVLARLVGVGFKGSNEAPASVRDAAMLALAQTRSGIATVKVMAVAIAVILGLIAIAVVPLSSSGKMDAKAVTSFAVLCLVIGIFNGIVLWQKWKRNLRPRRDWLNAIVRDLDSH